MRLLPSLLMAVIAAGFLWLFFTRYWLYRACIDDAASSCVTPDGNLTGGGAVWIVPAIIFALMALLKLPWRRR